VHVCSLIAAIILQICQITTKCAVQNKGAELTFEKFSRDERRVALRVCVLSRRGENFSNAARLLSSVLLIACCIILELRADF